MPQNEIIWSCKKMQELTVSELHNIMKLRCEVFVVEQNCVFPDIDGRDPYSLHLCGWLHNQLLVAYCRILPPGVAYTEASIGRVASHPAYRRTGWGRVLMQKAIDHCHAEWGNGPIKIGAQQYLVGFYQSFGFEICSEPYVEDGIMHVEMILGK